MSPNSKAWIIWTKLAFAIGLFAITRCSDVAVLPVSVGQTASLPCHNAIHGAAQVVWKDKDLTMLTLNEAVLTDDRRFSIQHKYQNDWDLQISSVRDSDTGNYTCCFVLSGVCQTLKIVTLVIQIPPTIVNISSDVTVSTGGSTILICIAAGAPQPTVRWTLQLANAGVKELNSIAGIYRIANAEPSDAGRYECAATNGVPPVAYRSVQVIVEFKPQVLVPYREVRQQLDADTLLECHVRSSPIGDVYWEKNGRRLDSEPGRFRLSSVKGSEETQILFGLIVYKLRSDDLAQYTCVARNRLGTAVESVLLSAWHNGTLRLLSPPRDAVARTGQSVVIDCSVEGMTADDRLIWWRQEPPDNGSHNKTLFDSSTTDRRSWLEDANAKIKYAIRGQYNLEIRSVAAEDAGFYHCHVGGIGNFTANLVVVALRSAGGSGCSPAETNGIPATVFIAVVVCLVVAFVFVLVVVLLVSVKHYRRILDDKRHEQSTVLKTEQNICSNPTSSYM